MEIKIKNNKLISFHIDDEKPLIKCNAIWTKIENLIMITDISKPK